MGRSVAVVGGGCVGRTFGRLLRRAGYAVGPVVCRSAARAREAVAFIGAGEPCTQPAAAARGADWVLLSVPDDAIEPLARTLRTDARVVHFCGTLPSSVLAPTGGRVGAIHPLRSFADPAVAAEAFPGTFCLWEGEEPEALERLVRECGGRPIRVRSDGKPFTHAGAVFASNYVVAMVETAVGLFERAGVSRSEALEPLLGLLGGTLENLRRVGLPQALTGPIARGEVGTVRAHLAAMEAAGLADLYRTLGRAALEVARARGLSGAAQAELERILQ
jgi:predicted short-subunit dehydrogenase-like oxidoreductase (DUF2520 family)